MHGNPTLMNLVIKVTNNIYKFHNYKEMRWLSLVNNYRVRSTSSRLTVAGFAGRDGILLSLSMKPDVTKKLSHWPTVRFLGGLMN